MAICMGRANPVLQMQASNRYVRTPYSVYTVVGRRQGDDDDDEDDARLLRTL